MDLICLNVKWILDIENRKGKKICQCAYGNKAKVISLKTKDFFYFFCLLVVSLDISTPMKTSNA